MDIDAVQFRRILAELIDESPLACRGLLGLCAIEFTTRIPTAHVTLGVKSTLRVNLDFVAQHCGTAAHVKALLLHEILHVLLGHTRRFRVNSPAKNFAADAVINALIHRQLGEAYSSFFRRLYARADMSPLCLLLCPSHPDDFDRAAASCQLWIYDLQVKLTAGEVVFDDVLELAKELKNRDILEALQQGKLILLGNHDGTQTDADIVPEWLQSKLKDAVRQLGFPGGPLSFKGSSKECAVPLNQDPVVAAWEHKTAQILNRLLGQDRTGAIPSTKESAVILPVMHAGARRAGLTAVWSPLLPDITWPLTKRAHGGSTVVYLDVSGSMNLELKHLAVLMSRFQSWIRPPLWVFSEEVHPAQFRRGELVVQSTGGTSLECVFRHIALSKPAKALIVTDGYVGEISSAWRGIANQHGVEFLVSANGSPERLAGLCRPVTRLGSLSKMPCNHHDNYRT